LIIFRVSIAFRIKRKEKKNNKEMVIDCGSKVMKLQMLYGAMGR